eukprot:6208679-Pleurochrysis_carterae.AAC.1
MANPWHARTDAETLNARRKRQGRSAANDRACVRAAYLCMSCGMRNMFDTRSAVQTTLKAPSAKVATVTALQVWLYTNT